MRLILALLLSTTVPAMTADITGVPRIVDGDTVQIDATKIRLSGIDAPEAHQFCVDPAEEQWECGITARGEPVEHAGAKPWTCHVSGLDRYGRSLAACEVNGEDIQQWLVRSGWALSFVRYSHTYDADEKAARDAGDGMGWRLHCTVGLATREQDHHHPWRHKRAHRRAIGIAQATTSLFPPRAVGRNTVVPAQTPYPTGFPVDRIGGMIGARRL
jgi:endonuclease YncB( thermonuclease family)